MDLHQRWRAAPAGPAGVILDDGLFQPDYRLFDHRCGHHQQYFYLAPDGGIADSPLAGFYQYPFWLFAAPAAAVCSFRDSSFSFILVSGEELDGDICIFC